MLSSRDMQYESAVHVQSAGLMHSIQSKSRVVVLSCNSSSWTSTRQNGAETEILAYVCQVGRGITKVVTFPSNIFVPNADRTYAIGTVIGDSCNIGIFIFTRSLILTYGLQPAESCNPSAKKVLPRRDD